MLFKINLQIKLSSLSKFSLRIFLNRSEQENILWIAETFLSALVHLLCIEKSNIMFGICRLLFRS